MDGGRTLQRGTDTTYEHLKISLKSGLRKIFLIIFHFGIGGANTQYVYIIFDIDCIYRFLDGGRTLPISRYNKACNIKLHFFLIYENLQKRAMVRQNNSTIRNC